MRRFMSGFIYAMAGAIGVLAFTYPFFLRSQAEGVAGMAQSGDASLVTTALVGIALVALLVEVQGQSISSKMIATLGVLVAIVSVLRFIDVAMPLPGGFSPIFAPIILAGYVFGGRFGFLLGALTLLTSALITGGVGPWLPYQMFAAGWVGMSAGGLGRLLRPSGKSARVPVVVETLALVILGGVWGILFGAIMNLYFWPFAMGPVDQTWSSDAGWMGTLSRYATFYLATSLAWDIARAVGNAALILALGQPMVQAFSRFERRFRFEVRQAVGGAS